MPAERNNEAKQLDSVTDNNLQEHDDQQEEPHQKNEHQQQLNEKRATLASSCLSTVSGRSSQLSASAMVLKHANVSREHVKILMEELEITEDEAIAVLREVYYRKKKARENEDNSTGGSENDLEGEDWMLEDALRHLVLS